jgi:hypothetical protein
LFIKKRIDSPAIFRYGGAVTFNMSQEIVNILLKKSDIFNYVVGNSSYDPIEQCIDPTLYETYSNFILRHDGDRQEYLYQDVEYEYFFKEMTKLKKTAPKMESPEILRICEELEGIAPKTINL